MKMVESKGPSSKSSLHLSDLSFSPSRVQAVQHVSASHLPIGTSSAKSPKARSLAVGNILNLAACWSAGIGQER